MSTEANKNAVRRGFEQGMNKRSFEVWDEVLAPNYVNHDMPAPSPGPAGMKQVLAMFTDAFPDMQITLHDVFGEGDKVATRGSWKGTHKGAFMGIPATGKSVEVKFIDMWRFENAKAVENWVSMDMLGLMQQLGVVPASGR
jgi:steroid delta-isomerase-like uncharacterized protein